MLLLNARALDCGRPPLDATLRLALANAAAPRRRLFPSAEIRRPIRAARAPPPPGDDFIDLTDLTVVSTVPTPGRCFFAFDASARVSPSPFAFRCVRNASTSSRRSVACSATVSRASRSSTSLARSSPLPFEP